MRSDASAEKHRHRVSGALNILAREEKFPFSDLSGVFLDLGNRRRRFLQP